MADDEQMVRRIIAKMDMQHFTTGSTHQVEVTHINDPKSFYVQLASLNEEVQLLEGRGDPINDQDIMVAKRVIYKSKILNKYVRGDIEFICFKETSASCTIFAVDYGCRDKHIPSKHIYLPDLELDCPPLALHCQLHLCEPKGDVFEKDALDAMKFFVGKHTAKMIILFKNMDKFTVELQTVECPDDVSTMLGLLHFTTFTQSTNVVNRFGNTSKSSDVVTYQFKNLKVGERLCVRVQSGDSISSFYVAEVNDFKTYIRQVSPFTQYCRMQKLQDVAVAESDGRCCGVRVGQPPSYERAYVIKVTTPGAKALVKLVDWGKEVEVNFDCIKPNNSTAYTNPPAIAIYCSSTQNQVFENGLGKFLFPGFTFVIDIVELGNGIDVPHKVNLHRVLGR